MSSDGDTTTTSSQDGGATADPDQGTGGAEGTKVEETEGAEAVVEPEADLCAKFSAFCDVKAKSHFTPKACNKLVKDCFESSYKFKNTILSNRVDSSVFSKCKEKGKSFMVVNGDNCNKFLQLAAHEFAKLKKNNEKLDKADPLVDKYFNDLKTKVKASTGPTIKRQKQSATGNVAGLTDTKKYTGTHKLRFDESGKGRGKEGRVDKPSKSGYVANYKGEGTFDENQPENEAENATTATDESAN